MRRISWVVRTFPFTLLGLASFIVLVLAARGVVDAFGPWRLAFLPAYVSALPPLFAAAQLFPRGPVPIWYLALAGAFRLALFLGADYMLARWRGRGLGDATLGRRAHAV